jgi:single-strand DNA-binding protein
MAGVNNCVFIGNVGRDPETRSTAGGKEVCNFSLAVNEKKDGEPLWIRVAAFDKLAGICQQYLKKGKQVYVQGRLQVRTYEKDGVEKTSVEMVANSVQFLGGKDDRDSGSERPAPRPRTSPQSNADDFGPPPGSDDDIPF